MAVDPAVFPEVGGGRTSLGLNPSLRSQLNSITEYGFNTRPNLPNGHVVTRPSSPTVRPAIPSPLDFPPLPRPSYIPNGQPPPEPGTRPARRRLPNPAPKIKVRLQNAALRAQPAPSPYAAGGINKTKLGFKAAFKILPRLIPAPRGPVNGCMLLFWHSVQRPEFEFRAAYTRMLHYRRRAVYKGMRELCPYDTGRMYRSLRQKPTPKAVIPIPVAPAFWQRTIHPIDVSYGTIYTEPNVYYAKYVSRYYAGFDKGDRLFPYHFIRDIFDFADTFYVSPITIPLFIYGLGVYLCFFEGLPIPIIIQTQSYINISIPLYMQEDTWEEHDNPGATISYRKSFGFLVLLNLAYPQKHVPAFVV